MLFWIIFFVKKDVLIFGSHIPYFSNVVPIIYHLRL